MTSKKDSAHKAFRFKRYPFGFLFSFYAMLILITILLPCCFSYQRYHNEISTQINGVYTKLSDEYKSIVNNVWQLYMPFFEYSSDSYDVLQNYVTPESDTPLTPIEKRDLNNTLQQMLLRNDNVKWIAIYCEERSDNYILSGNASGLNLLPGDFPYMEELQSDSYAMEVYGIKPLSQPSAGESTFAICGGLPYFIGKGKILIGYSTASFQSICNSTAFHLDSLCYRLTSNDSVIFEYRGPNAVLPDNLSKVPNFNNLYLQGNKLVTFYSDTCGRKASELSYSASQWEIFLYCNSDSPLFILLFVVFASVSIWIYTQTLKKMYQEVAVIQNGLDQISENNLGYQIDDRFQQDQLSQIAQSINRMAQRLEKNVHLAYHYEIKQRETELSELQSKFNPHFLYNTLEMIRSRCEANGDDETANLISDMTKIFRGLISSRNFVPLNEELAFTKHYLSLFSARYGDSVQIRYDIESELFSYGIIKNIFQPIIENYFVHGFDTAKANNYLLVTGKSLDEHTMLFSIENNGLNMAAEDMHKLNAEIHKPIDISTESYGLKNIHQRLVLFYGAPCGLSVTRNTNSDGISVKILASKMTCAEYEELKKPNEEHR